MNNLFKVLIGVGILLTCQLQYRLWFGDGSIKQIMQYQERLDDLQLQVGQKREQNQALYAEVLDLRKGQEAIEELARQDLGMIKEDETFFQVIE